MSRHNAMHRPPRLSQVEVADFDDEAVTCSARESRVALAELGRSIPMLASTEVEIAPASYGYAYEPAAAHALGMTREEPLLASQAPPAMQASVRAAHRSQMTSVPPPADSWRESPWVMPSVRQAAMTPPASAARPTNLLHTIGIAATGFLMFAIVLGAVMFAKADREERSMQFTQRAAAQQLPSPAATTLPVAAPTVQPTFAMPVAAPVQDVAKGRVIAASTSVVPPAEARVEKPLATPKVPTARTKEPVAVRTAPPASFKMKEPRDTKPASEPKAEAGKKTREEQEVESLLAKLGEAQLR